MMPKWIHSLNLMLTFTSSPFALENTGMDETANVGYIIYSLNLYWGWLDSAVWHISNSYAITLFYTDYISTMSCIYCAYSTCYDVAGAVGQLSAGNMEFIFSSLSNSPFNYTCCELMDLYRWGESITLYCPHRWEIHCYNTVCPEYSSSISNFK